LQTKTITGHALLIDIAVPGDTRIDEKEQDKVDKYQDHQD